MSTLKERAAVGRANAGITGDRGTRPSDRYRESTFPATMRGAYVGTGSKQVYEVNGYATIYNVLYDMYDAYGKYQEVMDDQALTASLAMQPDVAFLVGHKGIAMARTRSSTPTLFLNSDSTGLNIRAKLNPARADVKDLATAIDDGDVTEMSFAFLIDNAEWDKDFEVFRILRADINRGDVSAVNFGANPYTSIGASVSAALSAIDAIPDESERARWIRTASVQMLRRTANTISDEEFAEVVSLGRMRGSVERTAEMWGTVGQMAKKWDKADDD